MRIWTTLFIVCSAVVVAACANATLPSAVGVTRPQILWVPASLINGHAKQQYDAEVLRARNEGRLNADAGLTSRVNVIAGRVQAQVGAFRADATSWAWEVNVISSEEINAFGRAGGKIIVMSDLISKLALTDDEIACVLGHETAHALREHTREKVSYAALMAGATQAASKDLTRMPSAYETFPHPQEAEMEIEADLIGMELAARAGYDPRGALSFIGKLQRQGAARSHAFGQSHPDYGQRKRRLREKIDALGILAKSTR